MNTHTYKKKMVNRKGILWITIIRGKTISSETSILMFIETHIFIGLYSVFSKTAKSKFHENTIVSQSKKIGSNKNECIHSYI